MMSRSISAYRPITRAHRLLVHLLTMCLLVCRFVRPDPGCPTLGWTCQQELGDVWTATCTLPGMELVKVSYDEPKPPNYGERVTIYCETPDSPQQQQRIPADLLVNFTGIESIDSFRIIGCSLAENHTLASILNGHEVRKLRYSPSTPLGDTLDAEIFRGLDQLEYLNLEKSGITELREHQFVNLPALASLSLKFNSLVSLPSDTFAGLINLTNIDLSNNNLTELIEPWSKLTNVRRLYLLNNRIETVSRAFISSLPELVALDLQANRIEQLAADTFHDAPLLQTLNLFTNNLSSVPGQLLANHTQLRKINLSDNRRLTTLPPGLLRKATELTDINLERCSITTIPIDFFRSLINLNSIKLAYNDISELDPGTFAGLQNLRSLDLSHNNLTQLVVGAMNGLISLEDLKLKNNQLEEIQTGVFYQQQNMRWLDLSVNRLQNLPGQLFARTSKLKDLVLSRNNLTHARSSQPLFELPISIEKLDISRNSFAALPSEWLTVLTRLDRLDLSYNNLSSFVSIDCQPTSENLVLDLRHNRISSAHIDLQVEDIVAESNDNGASQQSKTTRAMVLLGENPFECDCNADDLFYYYNKQINQAYLYSINLDNLQCARPVPVAGRKFTELSSSDLVCTDIAFCPQKCRCQKFTRGWTVVDCNGSGTNQLPFQIPYNTSVLNMANNSVTQVVGLEEKRWSNLRELYLNNNDIETLANITKLPSGLRKLNLANNSLRMLSSEELDMLNRYPRVLVDLRGNPWRCDCAAVDFKRWLSENAARVDGLASVFCDTEGEKPAGQPVYTDDVCPKPYSTTPRALMVGVTVAGLVLAAGVAAAAIGYYRFQHEIKVWLYARGWCLWFVTETEVDRDKTYDAFISFSQEDSEFVASHLLPGLEHGKSTTSSGGSGVESGGADHPCYRVCIHYRDWLAGEWIPDQIVRSVQESRRTIVVLSKNFIRSVWGRLEFKAAHHQALQDRTNRVVVVVLGDLPPASEMDPELKLYVKFNTYLKWGDPWFWEKLRYAMPHSPLALNGTGPPHLPLPPSKQQPRNNTPSSKVPNSFLTATTTPSPPTPIVERQTRLPMTSLSNGNGNVIRDKISADKLVRV